MRDDLGRFVKGHTKVGTPGRKKGCTPWNKGLKTDPAIVEKLSVAHIGQKAWNKGKSNWWAKGELNNRWNGGITPEYHRIRNSPEYFTWRDSVFKRDDYTCQLCNRRGETIHAHHIKSFKNFPESRFEESNGITLCKPCHLYVHTEGIY